MEVNGPGSVQGAFPVKPASQVQPASEVSPPVEPKPVESRDEVEISAASRVLDDLSRSPDVRTERLEQIRTAIEAGEYDTQEKLESAMQKLLDEIGYNESDNR